MINIIIRIAEIRRINGKRLKNLEEIIKININMID